MRRAVIDEPTTPAPDSDGATPTTRRRGWRSRGNDGGPRPRRFRVPARVVVFGLLLVAAVGLLMWLLSWSSPVPVREVFVTGASADTDAAARAAADIPVGTPIREVDRDAIQQRVEALAGIDTVELQLQRPWTVVVAVVERFPFAVAAKGDQWAVIDHDGVEIDDQPDKPAGLPVVADVPDRLPVLQALEALSPDLRDKIQKGTINKDGDVVLTMKSGTDILWGLPGPDDAQKAQAVAVLLQYEPEKINVTVPQRPGLSGDLRLPKQNRTPSESP